MNTKTARDRCEYVEVAPGVNLFCRSVGEESIRPPVLLLHGNRDNHTHYTAVQELLAAAGWHSIALDWRGHGLSSTLDCMPAPALLAKDVLAVVEHFCWRRIVLVGHSLGSVAAMTFADAWRERLAALVLMGTAATFSLPFRRPEIPATRETWPEFVREANARARHFFFHEQHPETARRVSAAWAAVSFDTHQQLSKLRHPDLRELVRGLSTPTLVVAGEQDRCTTPDAARWIQENHRDAQLVTIPNTAHFMYVEDAPAVAKAVNSFLTTRVLERQPEAMRR